MRQTAKLFKNGKSQAVRLPMAYRFEGSEVCIRRDEASGDVILSRKPETLTDFFAFAHALDVGIPSDFLNADERQTAAQNRDPFADGDHE
ncbi:MAG: antitoxin [Sphingomonadaceae bacterium]